MSSAKGRIGQHHVEVLARVLGQAVGHVDGATVQVVADAVQVEIHDAQPRGFVDDLPAVQGLVLQEAHLLPVQVVVVEDVVVRGQEEAPRARGRVHNGHARLRAHDFHDGLDEGPRGEVLARARFHVLGVLFQQALVNGALDVHTHACPGFAVDEVDEAPQLGGVLDLVLGLAEDAANEAAAVAQFGENGAVVGFQFRAFQAAQAGPVVRERNGAGFAQELGALVVHLEEEEVGELFQVVAIGDAVVPQNVAVVPDALDDGGCAGCGHGWASSSSRWFAGVGIGSVGAGSRPRGRERASAFIMRQISLAQGSGPTASGL